jgi:hypothetical protein
MRTYTNIAMIAFSIGMAAFVLININRRLGFVLGVSIIVDVLGAPATYAEAHRVFGHGWWTVAVVQIVAALAGVGVNRRRTTARI